MKTVLIVDDEPGVREILSQALEEKGYDVRTAKNGEEALGDCIQFDFDLIITDSELAPGQPTKFNGRRLIEAVRGLGKDPKVVLISGNPAELSDPPVGAVTLEKPVSLSNIFAVLWALLGA